MFSNQSISHQCLRLDHKHNSFIDPAHYVVHTSCRCENNATFGFHFKLSYFFQFEFPYCNSFKSYFFQRAPNQGGNLVYVWPPCYHSYKKLKVQLSSPDSQAFTFYNCDKNLGNICFLLYKVMLFLFLQICGRQKVLGLSPRTFYPATNL